MSVDLNNMTPEQLTNLSRQAAALAKEKKSGIPTTDAEVVKLAGSIQNLALKMGIDVEKVVVAIGRNFKTPVQLRVYAMPDPNKPRKPRTKK